MSEHRFYVSNNAFSTTNVTLSGDEAYHLRKVLRLRIDDRVQVFNGFGQEWVATIKEFDGQNVILNLHEAIITPVESPLSINLVQGLIKGDRFDLVIQKAVELGVTTIQPLISQFTDFPTTKGQAEKRLDRWERIALEATKQCGRNYLTTILAPLDWNSLILQIKTPTIFFAERGGSSLSRLVDNLKIQKVRSITLIVGSEGGWSNEELSQASQLGFYLTTLGNRILRAETAGITAVALMQHLLGDLD